MKMYSGNVAMWQCVYIIYVDIYIYYMNTIIYLFS